MNKRFGLVLALVLGFAVVAPAETVLKSGYEPGLPTQDWDAALAAAKKAGLPVFVDFTGSDWCYWCQIMQKNVFSKAEWTDWAKGRLVVVTIDFPQDASIVPAAFRDRNRRLSAQFGVEGYPTYVVLDSDGVTELGRLGAGQSKTPRSFIAEVQGLTRLSRAQLDLLATKLTGAALTEYQAQVREYTGLAAYIAEWKRRQAENQIEGVKAKIVAAQVAYARSRLSAADRTAWDAAEAEKGARQRVLDQWLATEPVNNEENQKKYSGFLADIAAQQALVDALVVKYLN